jgi:two-component system KDP operon response regulator KdpE
MFGKPRKVLIVDDEREMQLWLKALFESVGYECVTAEDGAMAISTAMREEPDLMILDLGLPAGSGVFVLETLRKHPMDRMSKMPIIVFSGDKWYDKNEAFAAGATAYFTKPARNEDLLDAAEKAMALPH